MSNPLSRRERHFIRAEDLALMIGKGAPPVILDIRFHPAESGFRQAYDAGHVPGAFFVDLQAQLAGRPSVHSGRRPLPAPDDFQRTIRGWGIDIRTPVVVYGDNGGAAAARAWWVLTWAGVENVRFLDGGWENWVRSGHPVSREAPPAGVSGFTIDPGQLQEIDADQAASIGRNGLLIDARDREQYLGASDGGSPVAGHIPGAINIPSRDHFTADGFFLPEEEIGALYARLRNAGGRPRGVYCGGGVGAANTVLALRSIGLDIPLFVGSWSAWASDPSRPAETGPAADVAE